MKTAFVTRRLLPVAVGLVSGTILMVSPATACGCVPNVGDLVDHLADRASQEAEYKVAPSRPTNLTAQVAKPRSVHLAWDASSPGVYGSVEYVISRWDSDTRWYTYFSTADPYFTDGTVRRRVSYTYHVVACDDRGNCSNWSNQASVNA